MAPQEAPTPPALNEGASAGKKHVVVLGGGIAGLSAAYRLNRAGYAVTLLEATGRLGGTHRDFRIGPYTFDAGSFFYEGGARLFDLAPGLKEMCQTRKRILRRVARGGQIQPYAFTLSELRRWPPRQLVVGLFDLLTARMRHRRDGTLDAICRRRLGDTIYAGTGLSDYIARFHHIPANQIDEAFFFSRMSQIDRATRSKAILDQGLRILRLKKRQVKVWPPLYIRPAEGYAPIFGAIARELSDAGVSLNLEEPVTGIARGAAGLTVETAKARYSADAVVSTIPVEVVHRLLFGETTGLVSLNLLTLFVSAASITEEAGNVLYNFERDGAWKRATIYSRLYPEQGDGRAFFAVEITLPPGSSPDPEKAFTETAAHMEGLGLAEGMSFEGHTVVPHAYPVYSVGLQDEVQRILDRISEFGIVSLGRQGRFEYLPTSTGVIRRVSEELASSDLVPLSVSNSETTDPARS
ncbi:protoporphyrinogen/coproporphyrinogen oxidase [Jannaschia aquimarina]|uniref:MnmC_2 protein n=1 Tax=Jannaschia aquimarina TaxID=935700 RepID=A0A0D1EFA7_9RHOB|nr:FAD-dependent oxidoreductase [Jannaschia aquimarina]KIT16299.1 tRNA 5-methylaminomethyl-2-thiouridine biosynthesis bifunctional protein MnmC [Jannaschia aquimarina]SNT26638.1 Protoporphyrinogen oxidase [Jannaschia aquimarina]